MGYQIFLDEFKKHLRTEGIEVFEPHKDELYIRVKAFDFRSACLFVHTRLHASVVALFATDERKDNNAFNLFCVFLNTEFRKWLVITTALDGSTPRFDSLAKDMFSATLFEREIREMFGIEPIGAPDARRLNLHDEVWPQGAYPLRKDFVCPGSFDTTTKQYIFNNVSGHGIFEVPVGPVHAGIIGPGHFRFSSAGEPIVNLEIRLGFTHRGVEKLFENKNVFDGLKISEVVVGDSAFAHSWSFCNAVEKIMNIEIPQRAFYLRAICLELERLYNHAIDIGGIALDVSFTFAAQFASCIKEDILRLNEKLTGSRYLKGFIHIGGVKKDFNDADFKSLNKNLKKVLSDFKELEKILYGSVSFMDRVDDTGILKKKTAQDLGIVGLVGRASGMSLDLRKVFSRGYMEEGFSVKKEEKGDVLARLKVRFDEVDESVRLISSFSGKLSASSEVLSAEVKFRSGFSIGAVEAWRGPVFYWVKMNAEGIIERCKIVDPSFHNWQGLSFAVLGNIIPDFPLCNKSFDLSYAGNDL